jgi:hypothetical protein
LLVLVRAFNRRLIVGLLVHVVVVVGVVASSHRCIQ